MRFVACLVIVTAMTVSAPSQAQTPPAATVPAQTDGATAQVTVAPKMHCKSYVETGSLAKMHKECHTDAEWRAMADQNRRDAQSMLDSAAAQGSGH